VAPGAGHAGLAVAQWNDDFHHALHAHLTGERDGYYADYADDPLAHLGRCLAEGFAYQGARSAYRGGAARGEPSATLPPTVFVNYLQTHDQVGNRPFGERLSALVPEAALRAAAAVCLLAPAPPMLFMGEEYAAAQPFLFFCDFADPEIARNVRAGRNRYHARFRGFDDAALDARHPDPTAEASFRASRLDWEACARPRHARMLAHYAALLDLRRRWIVAPPWREHDRSHLGDGRRPLPAAACQPGRGTLPDRSAAGADPRLRAGRPRRRRCRRGDARALVGRGGDRGVSRAPFRRRSGDTARAPGPRSPSS
jgi:malto-oligosyltrehalose trehalohydrolase